MKRVLVVFVDGVGIGADDPGINAFAAVPPPRLTELLDGVRIAGHTMSVRAGRATLVPLDAQLGVSGLPQSGTGQFSLLTGSNGAAQFGRHYGPWVPTTLRASLQRSNLLTIAKAAGRAVAFANAYPEELIATAHANGEFAALGPLRAGPPLAAAGAGLLTRHTSDVHSGRALTSEITNEAWRERLNRTTLPTIDAATAGAILARIANENDLTLYAHYATDYAGHQQDLEQAIAALRLVDEFIAGVLDLLDPAVTLLVVSDHGNLEDASTGHTRNPALGLIVGSQHHVLSESMRSLLDVTPAVLRHLDIA
jgi:2,3-bisphosphoglycerate-independent phosphoglycerate mutase